MKICIDSQIVIWGIKKQGDGGMVEMAEHFFKWADDNKHEIIIPTIVIGEILSPEPAAKRAQIYNELENGFIIAPYDALCALRYAELIHNKGIEVIKEEIVEIGISRQKMKCDFLIVATALATQSNCIYSYDKGVIKFSKDIIDVRSLPPLLSKQNSLFP